MSKNNFCINKIFLDCYIVRLFVIIIVTGRIQHTKQHRMFPLQILPCCKHLQGIVHILHIKAKGCGRGIILGVDIKIRLHILTCLSYVLFEIHNHMGKSSFILSHTHEFSDHINNIVTWDRKFNFRGQFFSKKSPSAISFVPRHSYPEILIQLRFVAF